MKIVHRNPWMHSISGKEVDFHDLYKDKSLQVLRFDLQPGESLGPKILPCDMLYYIVEGSPTIRVADDKMIGIKGMLIECPAHLVHSLSSNVGDSVQVLAIKVPAAEKKEHFRDHFFYGE